MLGKRLSRDIIDLCDADDAPVPSETCSDQGDKQDGAPALTQADIGVAMIRPAAAAAGAPKPAFSSGGTGAASAAALALFRPSPAYKQTRLALGGVPKPASLFTDESFPPEASSIDGRRHAAVHAREGRGSASALCACGAAPRLKQVWKEGPNRGRYFHTCAANKCDHFAWADHAAHQASALKTWERFGLEHGFVLVKGSGFDASDVMQGGVGDCWFLSAVALVAERQDLIERVVSQRQLDANGACTMRLFLDGRWEDVLVDNWLPCVPAAGAGARSSKRGAASEDAFRQAYSKAAYGQLWVPLLEKGTRQSSPCRHGLHCVVFSTAPSPSVSCFVCCVFLPASLCQGALVLLGHFRGVDCRGIARPHGLPL